MRDYQEVRIAHDRERSDYKTALTHRAIFEFYSQQVTLHDLWTEESVLEFFAAKTDSAVTLLECHGWGKTDADAVINLEVLRHKTGPEFEAIELRLTPANIRDVVKAGSGILINKACWSGKQVFADAFLSAGYGAYLAPERTSDSWSALQFLTAFIGYLKYEVRDADARNVSTREALDLARRLDHYPDGAAGWRLFEGTPESI